jgi:hypothetical protein
MTQVRSKLVIWPFVFGGIVMLATLGLGLMFDDATPLLTQPRPDLRWPLGLAGAVVGWLYTRRVLLLPPKPPNRFGRWSALVMIPLFLGMFLAVASTRLYELVSFRNADRAPELATLAILDTSQGTGQRSDNYRASVLSPWTGTGADLIIDRALFERLDPSRDCLTVLIEHASNGAARVIGIQGPTRCSAELSRSSQTPDP